MALFFRKENVMSLENHPNFHALKFVTDILASYFECVRGGAEKNSPNITKEVQEFAELIEAKVDRRVNHEPEPE